LILIKKHGYDLSPITLNFVSMFVGTLTIAVLALVFERGAPVVFDAKGIGSVVYLGTFGTVVTFVTYFWLLKRVEVVYLSLVSFVTPIVAVFLGAVVLDESLAPHTFLGAGLVLMGLMVANGKGLAAAILKNTQSDAR
jgi:drug/metabolite transporter (DMT)-like permease